MRLVQSTLGNSSHSSSGIKFIHQHAHSAHCSLCTLFYNDHLPVHRHIPPLTMSSTEAEPRLSQPHASTASLGAKVAGVTLFGVTVKTYQNLIQKRHPLSGECGFGARESPNDYWSRIYWLQIRSVEC